MDKPKAVEPWTSLFRQIILVNGGNPDGYTWVAPQSPGEPLLNGEYIASHETPFEKIATAIVYDAIAQSGGILNEESVAEV
jgi:hypothetical protein